MGERWEVGLMHIARDVSWMLYAAVLVVMIIVLIIVTCWGRCRNGSIGLQAILELSAIMLKLVAVDAEVEGGPLGMPPHRGWVSLWSVVARAGQEQINNDNAPNSTSRGPCWTLTLDIVSAPRAQCEPLKCTLKINKNPALRKVVAFVK
jgi:hypothetical protein